MVLKLEGNELEKTYGNSWKYARVGRTNFSWLESLMQRGLMGIQRVEEKGPMRLKARAMQTVRRRPVSEVLGLALDFDQYLSVSDMSNVKETLFLNYEDDWSSSVSCLSNLKYSEGFPGHREQ